MTCESAVTFKRKFEGFLTGMKAKGGHLPSQPPEGKSCGVGKSSSTAQPQKRTIVNGERQQMVERKTGKSARQVSKENERFLVGQPGRSTRVQTLFAKGGD